MDFAAPAVFFAESYRRSPQLQIDESGIFD
jgi:hypothetical protein